MQYGTGKLCCPRRRAALSLYSLCLVAGTRGSTPRPLRWPSQRQQSRCSAVSCFVAAKPHATVVPARTGTATMALLGRSRSRLGRRRPWDLHGSL